MTNAIDHSIGTDRASLANDARLELEFAPLFDGLADEARRNDERVATDELARANQEYLRAGYRRMYESFTGIPLDQRIH